MNVMYSADTHLSSHYTVYVVTHTSNMFVHNQSDFTSLFQAWLGLLDGIVLVLI